RRIGAVAFPVRTRRLCDGTAPRLPRQYPALRRKSRTPFCRCRRYSLDTRLFAAKRHIEIDARRGRRDNALVMVEGGQAAPRAVPGYVVACTEFCLPHVIQPPERDQQLRDYRSGPRNLGCSRVQLIAYPPVWIADGAHQLVNEPSA